MDAQGEPEREEGKLVMSIAKSGRTAPPEAVFTVHCNKEWEPAIRVVLDEDFARTRNDLFISSLITVGMRDPVKARTRYVFGACAGSLQPSFPDARLTFNPVVVRSTSCLPPEKYETPHWPVSLRINEKNYHIYQNIKISYFDL